MIPGIAIQIVKISTDLETFDKSNILMPFLKTIALKSVIDPIIELQILAFLKEQDKWRSTLAQLATPTPEGAEELLKAYLDSMPK